MRLGGSFDFIFDEYNKVSVIGETTKLLVPTPQAVTDLNNDGVIDSNDTAINNQNYRKIGLGSGIFKSFGDAPDGFRRVKRIYLGIRCGILVSRFICFKNRVF